MSKKEPKKGFLQHITDAVGITGTDEKSEKQNPPPVKQVTQGRGNAPRKTPTNRRNSVGRGRGVPPKQNPKQISTGPGGKKPGQQQHKPKENPMAKLQERLSKIEQTQEKLAGIQALLVDSKQFEKLKEHLENKPLFDLKEDSKNIKNGIRFKLKTVINLLQSLKAFDKDFIEVFGDGADVKGKLNLAKVDDNAELDLSLISKNSDKLKDLEADLGKLEEGLKNIQTAAAGVTAENLNDAVSALEDKIDGLKVADLQHVIQETTKAVKELEEAQFVTVAQVKEHFVTKKGILNANFATADNLAVAIEAALKDFKPEVDAKALKEAVEAAVTEQFKGIKVDGDAKIDLAQVQTIAKAAAEAAVKNLELGLNEAAVKKIVEDAVKGLELGQNEAAVKVQIETALKDLQVGLDEAAVKTIVSDVVNGLELGQNEDAVKGQIETALKDLKVGLDEAAVKAIVSDAVKGLELGQNEAAVKVQIETALNDLEVGLNEAAVKKIVEDAVNGLELGQNEDAVKGQIETALKDLKVGLDEAAVKTIVSDAVKGLDLENKLDTKLNVADAVNEAKVGEIVDQKVDDLKLEDKLALKADKTEVHTDEEILEIVKEEIAASALGESGEVSKEKVQEWVENAVKTASEGLTDEKVEGIAKKIIADLKLEEKIDAKIAAENIDELRTELAEDGAVYSSIKGVGLLAKENQTALEKLFKFLTSEGYTSKSDINKDFEDGCKDIDAKVADEKDAMTAEEGKEAKDKLAEKRDELLAERSGYLELAKQFQGIKGTQALEQRLEALRLKIQENINAINGLKSTKGSGDANTGSVDLSGVNDEMAKLSKDLGKLQSEVNSISKNLETGDIAKTIREIDQKVGSLDTVLAQLSSTVADLHQNGGDAKVDLSGIEGQINDLREGLFEAFGEITKLGGKQGPADSFEAYRSEQVKKAYLADHSGKEKAIWEDGKKDLSKAAFESLGLKGAKDKKAKTDVVNKLMDALSGKGISQNGEALYRGYQSAKNVKQEIFGFVASDLGKCDGKSLRAMELKFDSSGNFISTKQDALIGSFVGKNILSAISLSRDPRAIQFAVVRERSKAFLGAGSPDVNVINKDPLGINPLHIAALVGHGSDLVDSYIEHHSQWVTQLDASGNSVLHYAAASWQPLALEGNDYQHHEALQYSRFVELGADPFEANNQGYTPFEVALASGNKAFIKWVMTEFKTTTIFPRDDFRFTSEKNCSIIDRAIELGNVESVTQVKSCLPLGAINFSNKNGNKPIHVAAKKGDVKLFEVVAEGANIHAKSTNPLHKGKTAVEIAAASGHKDIVTLLALSGAKLTRGVNEHMDNLLNSVELGNRRNAGDYSKNVRAWWFVNVWQNDKHDTTLDKIKQTFIHYGGDKDATISGGEKFKSTAKAFASRFISSPVKSDNTKTLKKATDPRVKLFSKPRHLAIKNHFLAGMKAINETLASKAGKVLNKGKDTGPMYYAFAPDNYQSLKGEPRKEAKAAAQNKADSLINLMYLRELMVAYHLYTEKMDQGIDKSKTHNYGVFAETLADTIVQLAQDCADAADNSRVDASKLLLTCHQGPEAICNHEIFKALGADFSRENVLGKAAKEHLRKEKGQDKDPVFKFMDKEDKSAKSTRSKKTEKGSDDAKKKHDTSEKEDSEKKKTSDADSGSEADSNKSKPKPKKSKKKADKKGDEEEKKSDKKDSDEEVSKKKKKKTLRRKKVEDESKKNGSKKKEEKKESQDEEHDKDLSFHSSQTI